MVDWSQGYNVSTEYTFGFYRDLAPSYLKLMCRLQGYIEPEGPLTCLELGCGQGLGPNLLAAANPDDTFIGVDFAPEHIVGAAALAKTAGLQNVTFLERSFEDLAARPDLLPPCDVITLHGIYSWVGPVQRQALCSIIRDRLKPGGLVYISYNCAAGWGPMTNFQRLLHDLAQARGGASQVVSALQKIKDLHSHDFGYLKRNVGIETHIDSLLKADSRYVAHEYLHEHWAPSHFQDVARDMRDAKLTFLGSTVPAHNLENLSLHPDIAQIINEENDADLREGLKDLHIGLRFRKDVFIRGAVAQTADQQVAALRNTHFALVRPRAYIGDTVAIPRGELKLGKAIYAQALDRLERGPAPLGDLAPQMADLRELIVVLLHMGVIHPAHLQATGGEAAARLNLAMTASPAHHARYQYAASPVIGSAVKTSPALLPAFAAALRSELHDGDVEGWVDRVSAPAADTASAVAQPQDERIKAVRTHLPLWRQLGMVPSMSPGEASC